MREVQVNILIPTSPLGSEYECDRRSLINVRNVAVCIFFKNDLKWKMTGIKSRCDHNERDKSEEKMPCFPSV